MGSTVMMLRIEIEIVIKMLTLMLIMMRWMGRSVIVVKIMSSSMCAGVFVCAGGKPHCCTHCSAMLFLTDLLSVSLFLCLLQIDLEPEGKVYVVIDLSGSSTEGKTTTSHYYYTLRNICIDLESCF